MICVAFYKHKKPVTSWRSLIERVTDSVIRIATRGKYSHCEIAIPLNDGSYMCYSSSPRDGGVRRKKMRLDANKWDLVPVSVTKSRAKRIFARLAGKKYDWLGVIGLGIWHNKNRYFCSEFCATVLKLDDTDISPNQLYRLLTQ